MMPIIDTHCHLDLDAFDDDRDQMIERAREAGVGAAILIGYNRERWQTTTALCQRYSWMRRSVGLHPNDAPDWSTEFEVDLVAEIERTEPIAVGEIGLDYFRSSDTADIQRTAFTRQVEIAREYDLPVIIHQRSAEEEVLEVLERFRPVRGVMHCFTGDAAFARQCVDLGMYLGVGGVATFPKSESLRDAIATAPPDRLLLETDAPFLAPAPRRGKRNEPAFLPAVVACLTGVLNLPNERVIDQTSQNAVALFGESLSTAVTSGMENR